MTFPQIIGCPDHIEGLAGAIEWTRDRRDWLESEFLREGALLFRGFPLEGADDFDAFVRAFDLPNFPHETSLSNAVRLHRTQRVFTANESPPDAEIRLHHEMAQTPIFPSRLFFFCEKPAEAGGATPLCRSDLLFEALERLRPDFAQACERHGLLYSLVMPPQNDPVSGQGRSWRGTFAHDSREGAEARMRSLGYRWEWLPGDCLRATTPVLPAVREISPGRKSFFNQLIATRAWADPRNDPSRSVMHGNGSPLDREGVALACELAEERCVALRWQRGDVALIDNFSVMHGRERFEGERVVLASLIA